jgi:uncharacterized protein YbjQ (UPF0145 family)
MDQLVLELLIELGLPIALIVVAFFTGRYLEGRHFEDLREREAANRGFLTVNFAYTPTDEPIETVGLVMGSVVVSVDHFKRFLAGLRAIVGGRLKAYETILDRGRREAILRMQADAKDTGCTGVINVRLETSRMANGRANNGTAGVEVLAFGTGIRSPGFVSVGAGPTF